MGFAIVAWTPLRLSSERAADLSEAFKAAASERRAALRASLSKEFQGLPAKLPEGTSWERRSIALDFFMGLGCLPELKTVCREMLGANVFFIG